MLGKIRGYAYKREFKPTNLTSLIINNRSVKGVLKKDILALNEEIHRDSVSPQGESLPKKEQSIIENKILEELIQVNKNISTIKDIQTKMQKCKLCGKNASELRAFYYNAFVCEACYEILDKPIPDHPQRLELRKKEYQNALKM